MHPIVPESPPSSLPPKLYYQQSSNAVSSKLILFFSSFLATQQHMEFLGQRSDLSYSCNNARSLTRLSGQGSGLRPSAPETLLIPLRHSRNSCFLKIK